MCVGINDHSNKLSKATFFAETKLKLKAGYTLMSNPFHHSSTAEAETGITGIKDWYHPIRSTAKVGTGITGIKDDTTHKLHICCSRKFICSQNKSK